MKGKRLTAVGLAAVLAAMTVACGAASGKVPGCDEIGRRSIRASNALASAAGEAITYRLISSEEVASPEDFFGVRTCLVNVGGVSDSGERVDFPAYACANDDGDLKWSLVGPNVCKNLLGQKPR